MGFYCDEGAVRRFICTLCPGTACEVKYTRGLVHASTPTACPCGFDADWRRV